MSSIGVPREIKEQEQRVAVVPSGVFTLCGRGHTVRVEAGAGEGSGFTDDEYREAGAEIIEGPDELFEPHQLLARDRPGVDDDLQVEVRDEDAGVALAGRRLLDVSQPPPERDVRGLDRVLQ